MEKSTEEKQGKWSFCHFRFIIGLFRDNFWSIFCLVRGVLLHISCQLLDSLISPILNHFCSIIVHFHIHFRSILDESPIPLVVVNEDPITIANLTEDIVQEAFETVDCLDKWAKSAKKAALFVTFAGFFSNIITKGVMKAIGFIFKAIMEHVEGISPTMAVLFPATMHLFFNTFCKIISENSRKNVFIFPKRPFITIFLILQHL